MSNGPANLDSKKTVAAKESVTERPRKKESRKTDVGFDESGMVILLKKMNYDEIGEITSSFSARIWRILSYLKKDIRHWAVLMVEPRISTRWRTSQAHESPCDWQDISWQSKDRDTFTSNDGKNGKK